ncbi:hypothetical protein HGA91_04820 [candidate division WWE3 bacterium]|nr:hypothetical protein [candidate division WWE3 bacterium]
MDGLFWFDLIRFILGLIAFGGLALAFKWAFLPEHRFFPQPKPWNFQEQLAKVKATPLIPPEKGAVAVPEGYSKPDGTVPVFDGQLGSGGPARLEQLPPRGKHLIGCTCLFCRMTDTSPSNEPPIWAVEVLLNRDN